MSIDIHQLSFSYGRDPVLREISFSVQRGKLTVLLGRNGSGKSTLVKLAAGLLPFRQGVIQVEGKNIGALSSAERARTIGYLPQFHTPVFPFTVEDVVLTGRAAFVWSTPGKRDGEQVHAGLEAVHLHHLRDRPYNALSGGERQLVLMARILAQDPAVILLDEPTSHLDLANQVTLLDLLRQLAGRGKTILAVLHDPNLAFQFADEMLFLKEGRLHARLSAGDRVNSELLTEVYGCPVQVVEINRQRVVLLAQTNPHAGFE
jgi:iron complex transport system ATP-binding protein